MPEDHHSSGTVFELIMKHIIYVQTTVQTHTNNLLKFFFESFSFIKNKTDSIYGTGQVNDPA
jgi:hypothetical protein